jgi:hypothetical protein
MLTEKGSSLPNETKPGGECNTLVIAPLIGQASESTTEMTGPVAAGLWTTVEPRLPAQRKPPCEGRMWGIIHHAKGDPFFKAGGWRDAGPTPVATRMTAV